jgi:preprotein translocase YajC subunit
MQDSSFVMQAVPLFLIVCVFYCLVIRPGRIAEGLRWKAVKALASGDRVVLTSGMFATFIALHGTPDDGEYEAEITDGVRVRVLEQGIKLVIPAAKTAADAAGASEGVAPEAVLA